MNAGTEHPVDPHHTAQGDWVCFAWLDDAQKVRCNRPLKGSYLRPVIPWEHKPAPPAARDETALPGLGTTE